MTGPRRGVRPGEEHAVTRTGLDRVLAQQKSGTAYVVIRAVRLLQSRGTVPGEGGLTLGGVHVHHALYGVALVVIERTLSVRGVRRHPAVRANALCTGLALVVDELDVLTGTSGHPAVRPVRALLDATALLWTLHGLQDVRRTWTGGHAVHRAAAPQRRRPSPGGGA